MPATSTAVNAASNDYELTSRLVAIAAIAGVPAPRTWVEAHTLELAAAPIKSEGKTIASAYEWAAAEYAKTPRPAHNMDALNDDELTHAVKHVAGLLHAKEETAHDGERTA